jgi:quinol monooxygenase YgiN
MHAVIRRYRYDPKESAAIDRLVRNGFTPTIRRAKGLVSYHWISNGNGEGTSFSVFQDKAGADESARLAADFVAMAGFLQEEPEVVEGTLVAQAASEPKTLAPGRKPMHAVIRRYRYDAKHGAEIDRLVRDGFTPIVREANGFVSYHWMSNRKGEGASLTVFQDKAGADDSVRLAADFVARNMANLLARKPEVLEGTLQAHVP